MHRETKDAIELALRSQLGNAQDNLYRAQAAARGRDTSKQWGESGQTLDEIIQDYTRAVNIHQAALDEWTQYIRDDI